MERKIKIDSKKSITLSSNIGWLFIYRDQFGRDIVPTLVPAVNAGIDLIYGLYKATDGKMTRESLLAIDTEEITDALYAAAAIESVDLLNIVWSMAKNADEDIPEPREWFRSFEVFPVDLVAPVVFDLIFKGLVSAKNLKRLQTLIQSLKPGSTSTASSSQEADED